MGPRWNCRGPRITHWVNPLLMDLDRSDHEPAPAVVETTDAVEPPRFVGRRR
jgi:hypothetical protein